MMCLSLFVKLFGMYKFESWASKSLKGLGQTVLDDNVDASGAFIIVVTL